MAEVIRAYHSAWLIGQGRTRPHAKYAALGLIAVAGRKPVRDITQTDIGNVLELWTHLALGTRYSRSLALKRIVTWLSEEHGAPRLHRHFPKLTPPSPRNTIVTERERAQILAAAEPYLRCWLLLCSDLAIRSGTAAMLGPQHHDIERGTLTFSTKKGREMCLPVTAELAALINPLSSPTLAAFVDLLHPLGHVHSRNLRVAFASLRKRVGINRRITPHDLRRTTAVSIYSRTKDLRIVQAVLGHRHLASTLHYLDHRNTPVDVSTLELAKLPTPTEKVQ